MRCISIKRSNRSKSEYYFRRNNKVKVVWISLRFHVDFNAKTRVVVFAYEPVLCDIAGNRITLSSQINDAPNVMFGVGGFSNIALI